MIYLLIPASIYCQRIIEDTIGYYHGGSMSRQWRNQLYEKKFARRTIALQEKFNGSNVIHEFIRYDDSIYVFTEYVPDSSGLYQFNLRTVRFGLVVLSSHTSGDTFLMFNPDTYEDLPITDTLLLPIGEWIHFHPNGERAIIGQYKNYMRDGIWRHYTPEGFPLENRTYELGKIIKSELFELNKARVDLSKGDSLFYMVANIRYDHQFFGYSAPSVNSEALILFSIFTNDVKYNTHRLKLGAYYDMQNLNGLNIYYVDSNGDFIKTKAVDENGNSTIVYFEKRWIDIE